MNNMLYSFNELNEDVKEFAKQNLKGFVFPHEMLISSIDFSMAKCMGFENINPILNVLYNSEFKYFEIVDIGFDSTKFVFNTENKIKTMWLLKNQPELIKYSYAHNMFDIHVLDDYNTLHPEITITGNMLFSNLEMHIKYNYFSVRNDILYDIKQQIYSNYESYISSDDHEIHNFEFIDKFSNIIKFNELGDMKTKLDELQILNFNKDINNFKLKCV